MRSGTGEGAELEGDAFGKETLRDSAMDPSGAVCEQLWGVGMSDHSCHSCCQRGVPLSGKFLA